MYVNSIIVMISLIKLRRTAASAVYRDKGITAYVTSAVKKRTRCCYKSSVFCSGIGVTVSCQTQRSILMTSQRFVFSESLGA